MCGVLHSEKECFSGDLKSDYGLRTALADTTSGVSSVISFANDKGYEISVDEANAYIKGQMDHELSDEQLGSVAGGKEHGILAVCRPPTPVLVL